MGLTVFSDEYFMKEALKEAREAFNKYEIPVGAVIVFDNKIIARAHNFTEQLCDVTAHAEMQAFTAASNFLGSKYLDECTLYVTVEPCAMCAGAAYWTQINKIVYGAKDEKKGFTNISKSLIHPRTKLISGVLENECASIIQEFFTKKRY